MNSKLLKTDISMKRKLFGALLLSSLVAACGGSDSKPSATQDAVSRKNAFNASVSGKNISSEQKKTSALSTALQLDGSMAGASSSQTPESFSFSGACPKGGSASGTVKSSVDGDKSTIEITTTGKTCASDENGNFDGTLKFSMTTDASSLVLTINGTTNAGGKNAKGEMASHTVEFKDLKLSASTASQGSGDVDVLGSVTCTGNLVIDGTAKTCADLAKEAKDASNNDQTKSSSSTNTSFYSETVQALQRGLMVAERSGKVFESASAKMVIDGVEQDQTIESSVLDANTRANLLTSWKSKSIDLSNFSSNAFVIQYSRSLSSLSPKMFKVTVKYTDGSTELIERETL